jgi:hypothetical protein
MLEPIRCRPWWPRSSTSSVQIEYSGGHAVDDVKDSLSKIQLAMILNQHRSKLSPRGRADGTNESPRVVLLGLSSLQGGT